MSTAVFSDVISCPAGSAPAVQDCALEASGLSTPDFYAAVGWLAREDKVDFGENGQTHDGTLTVHVEYYL